MPSLEPLSVERPVVEGEITPVCLDDGTTAGYTVNVTVQGAGGMGGTRTVPIEVVFALGKSTHTSTGFCSNVLSNLSTRFIWQYADK